MPCPLWLALCRGIGLLLRSWTCTSLSSSTARPGLCTCCPHRPPIHPPGLFQCHSEPITLSLFSCPSHPHISLLRLLLTAIIICFSSVAQSCPTLCHPMDCSTTGLPVHHQLLELTQTHVHGVGDVIQSSHPLSSPSPPTFNLSQHQSLFQ